MMVGIDLMELSELPKDFDKFLARIAREEEIEYIKAFSDLSSQKQRICALWCVKESVFKCLGLGKDSGVTTKDVELCHELSGKPYVKLHGAALEAFQNEKLKNIEISISHTKNYAVSVALASS